jgi:hypothetical protein
MLAECGDFNIHVRIERERLQDGMQFIVAGHLENTDIREAPHDAPEVLPLAGPLKIGGSLMLEVSEPLDRLAVNVRRNRNFDSYVKKHEISPFPIRLWHRAERALTLRPDND